METCVRGFSYIPEKITIQLVEDEELERTWRSRRRQLVKEREERIWNEFIKEKDVVEFISKDDPYQFLHQLPEPCLNELLEAELQRARAQETQDTEAPCEGEAKKEEQHMVSFAEDEKEDGEMFQIYDDYNEREDEPSGFSDEDGFRESTSESPVTVRERDSGNNSPTKYDHKEKTTENVSSVIESSIYCAKVKDLRMKLRDEIMSIIAWVERAQPGAEQEEGAARRVRRAAEFSARFNRIYMYQLKRQMSELKRHTEKSPPFAKHTHFHAQLVRIASLHHNLLQAFQVFHKSVAQTACLRAAAALLHALARAARAASALCAAVPAPPALGAPAALLYSDDIVEACDELDEAVCNHSLRFSELLSNAAPSRSSDIRRVKSKKRLARCSKNSNSNTNSKSNTDTRFSMYSLDTHRVSNGKSVKSTAASAALKLDGLASINSKKSPKNKSPKKTPRSRRPLMRAGSRPPRLRAQMPKDTEITTMVEGVDMQSIYMSRSVSPLASTARETPRTLRLGNLSSPRKAPALASPAWPPTSPQRGRTPQQLIKALRYMHDDAPQPTPVCKIDCCERETAKPDTYRSDKAKRHPKAKLPKPKEPERTNNGKVCPSEAKQIDTKFVIKVPNANESAKGIDAELAVGGFGQDKPGSSRGSVCVKESTDGADSCRSDRDSRSERRIPRMGPAREVSRLLKQLCSGDSSGSETVSGAKNAQLHFVNGGSPRTPSTPQLLKILETTIKKKKPPASMYEKAEPADAARHRLQFRLPEHAAAALLQYRTKFVQHMLESSLYANGSIGKPWEVICSVSDKIIEEMLLSCASEMQIQDVLLNLYNSETK